MKINTNEQSNQGKDELIQSILDEMKRNGLLDELTQDSPYLEIQYSNKTVICKIEDKEEEL
ncbi:hypothetical protein [Dysgonomonas sp. 520]|uniref:hypothetical protein n=1 Tax=Dysgonomonas sp. 520 TaxID=2302931 RepID=UPI0013D17016|nr:hypothetical protein [Dysgonomonas sp. 520]NDW08073.1 hypothetical protein [Dysgonomonas sp. 520]